MSEQLMGLFRELGEIQADVFRLNMNYDSTREEFDARFRRARGLRMRTGENLIDLTMQLREHITEDEWRKIQIGMAAYGVQEGE
jgi:hypothetical protein